MISFDFLRPQRPAVIETIRALRIPQDLRLPVTAIFGALIVVLGAYDIEAHRLKSAILVEAQYRHRLDETAAQVAETKIRVAHLNQRARLDRRIHDISSSGYENARRLAEIGNRLPREAWLSSIAQESDGIRLEGDAFDLTAVSASIKKLASAKYVGDPALLSAIAETSASNATPVVKYSLKVRPTQ